MGDHSMDTDDHDIDVEECDEQPSGSQTNHVFNDGIDFYIGQTFDSKEHLKILLKKAAIKRPFGFVTIKSNIKYYKVQCTSPNCGWMLRCSKYKSSRSLHKHASSHAIASVLMNDYIENKGPSTKEIQRTVFREFYCKPSYWKCSKAGIIAKNWVRGTSEHGYGCLPAYSYMVDSLNQGSRICIRLSDDNRFLYYFMSYAACIRGYNHMRKAIAVDGTYLYGKYEGVLLLCAVAQDTENHVYPIAFCVVDKECDDSWTYFFQQLKFIIADEPDLWIISDRHKSIANGISKTYEHAHHGLCMKHLSENLRKNFQCGDSLHAYFNVAKAYGYEEFDEHFQQFRDKSPEAAQYLEFEIGFEKWSRAHFPAKRYDVLTTNIAESLSSMLRDEREYPVSAIFTSISRRFAEILRQRRADIGNSNNIFVPSAEITLREKMTEGDSLFVSNINGDADEFTIIGSGRTAKVNLLNKTCSCREYELVKLPCAHAIAALRLKYENGYGSSIYKYSSPMYKVQSYILAFAETINVVPPESEWVVPEEYAKMYIAPLPYEPKIGRKRIKHIPCIAESFKPKGCVNGRRNKCSLCKGSGHKRTTC
ncbi:uncharacterized protein LOC132034883 [Lycium ferocissimum]|uniref:uncharacterized protein LOC132034883 n=1 Tax=Lycium ferocissimum TaxID=112874 RepID=UPI00281587B9|nr:uncharacterized protein LOC132034883 [Lycium ferocissimum]